MFFTNSNNVKALHVATSECHASKRSEAGESAFLSQVHKWF